MRKLAISLVVLCLTLTGVATAEEKEDKLTKIELGIRQIADYSVKKAATEMLAVVREYEPPKQGEEKTTWAEEYQIFFDAREVMYHVSGYEFARGVTASLKIRPAIRSLFEVALAKMSWIEQQETAHENCKKSHQGILDFYNRIKGNEPIPLPPRFQSFQDLAEIESAIQRFVDEPLKESALEMLAAIREYKPPEQGEESTDYCQQSFVYRKARQVFCRIERFEGIMRSGLFRSAQGYEKNNVEPVRPVIRALFVEALAKMSWIEQKERATKIHREQYAQTLQKYNLIKGDEPIPEAPDPKIAWR